MRTSDSRLIHRRLKKLIERLACRKSILPKSLLGKAISYALKQWTNLEVYLGDGRVEICNLVENMIRPAKLGEKNSMFFGSLEAGTHNALFYTLMANCRNHGLDPEKYLTEVIKRLPHHATVEQAAELTPARFAAARRAEAQAVAPNRLPPDDPEPGDEFRTLTIKQTENYDESVVKPC